MIKLDLVKEYKSYYRAGKTPEIVEFGEANCLSVEGKGEPARNVLVRKIEGLC